jgi:uncharacterized membrane protein YeiB
MWPEYDIKVPLGPERDRRIDLIRGIAVLGMIFVNTKYLFSVQSNSDDWLNFLSGLLDGRPAALFIILAGIGVSLMVHSDKSGTNLKFCRAKLLKRSAVLFIAGLLLLKYWTADILHFYGIYLLFAAILVGSSNRLLAFLSAVFLAASIWIHFEPDFDLLPSLETECVGSLACSWIFVWDLFLTGCYPVVPCLGLFLFGKWIGRHDLSSSDYRRKLFIFGLLSLIAAKVTEELLIGNWSIGYMMMAFDADFFLINSDPFPPGALYLLSAGGISLLIIAGCYGLSEKRMNNSWLVAICDAGRMSLSIYIIHIMVCGKYIEIKEMLECDYALLRQSIFIAALWCVGAVAAARMWLKRFSYGPLEWGLRAISKLRVSMKQAHQGK